MGWDEEPEDTWFTVDPHGRREEEPDGPKGPRRRRMPSLASILIGLVVVAIGVIAWINHQDAQRKALTPRPTPTQTSSTTPPGPTPSVSHPTSPAPTVTTVPPPLGRVGTWDLFALGRDSLTRIEMATGRTTVVAIGNIPEGQPMTLIPLRDRVLVQPQYEGQGRFVLDDGRVVPTEISANPAMGGTMVSAGPDPQHVWRMAQDGMGGKVELVDLAGRVVAGAAIKVPQDLMNGPVRGDVGRVILLEGVNGTYLADGKTLRRLTTGRVIANGSSGWLASECDDAHRCNLVMVARQGGARRVMGPDILTGGGGMGSMSPDGKRVVTFELTIEGMRFLVIDLETGTRRELEGGPENGYGGLSGVWSPDSRWYLVPTADSGVRAVEVDTGKARAVPMASLGDLGTLAVRTR